MTPYFGPECGPFIFSPLRPRFKGGTLKKLKLLFSLSLSYAIHTIQPDSTMEFLAAMVKVPRTFHTKSKCSAAAPNPYLNIDTVLAALAALKSEPEPEPKPKSRRLCSMIIFKGYGGGGDRCPMELREVWRGCKGYCQRGLDICAVHAKSRMRQQRKAATLIQSIVRRNRAKKLVAGLAKTFGQGQHRDVLVLILDEVRKGSGTEQRKSPPDQCAPLPVVRRSHAWPASWAIHSR